MHHAVAHSTARGLEEAVVVEPADLSLAGRALVLQVVRATTSLRGGDFSNGVSDGEADRALVAVVSREIMASRARPELAAVRKYEQCFANPANPATAVPAGGRL